MRIMKEGKSGLETQKPSWMCDSINTQKSGPLHSTYILVSRHSFVFSLSRSSLEYRMRQSWNVIYKYLFRQRFLYIWKGKAIHYWNLNITERNRRALSLSPDSRRIWREHSRWSRCLRCHCSRHNSPRGKTCNGNISTILWSWGAEIKLMWRTWKSSSFCRKWSHLDATLCFVSATFVCTCMVPTQPGSAFLTRRILALDLWYWRSRPVIK